MARTFGSIWKVRPHHPRFARLLERTHHRRSLAQRQRIEHQLCPLRPYSLQERTLLEVDQIIPLREAEDYTVRLKEKQEEIRHATESTIDFTRYDLTVNGTTYSNLWKRNLIRQAVATAVEAGVTLSQLEAIFPHRRLIVVDGTLSGEDFLTAAEAKKASDGYVFNRRRYF